jgi:hypothetical protein
VIKRLAENAIGQLIGAIILVAVAEVTSCIFLKIEMGRRN